MKSEKEKKKKKNYERNIYLYFLGNFYFYINSLQEPKKPK